MFVQTKETPVTGLLGPEIKPTRKRVKNPVKRGKYAWVADAMRRGMKRYRYQAHGEMYEYNENGTIIAACALGAAQDSISTNHYVWKTRARCPVDGDFISLQEIIVYLNDSEGWTRGRIAQWLERLE